MNTHPDKYIYKIITAELWAAATGTGQVPGMPIDTADGYMHFSTLAQLRETLRLHFKGQGDLALLKVEAAPLGDALKWEPSRGGDLFPHLYGPLGLDQVAASTMIAVDADGETELPESF